MPRFIHTLSILSVLFKVYGRQIPLQFTKETTDWDLDTRPAENTTNHLVFDTVNSLLQHWPNTRYRNGHTIVPGIVPLGTVLYHGTRSSEVPTVPEWLATDPEHSYPFCRYPQSNAACWHHTYVAIRPLKVLYFDGSSAAKMQGGPMDSQDILLWGKVMPEWTIRERKRIGELCDWGKRFGLDGFARMEEDFEIMYCDFKNGLQPVSKLNLASPMISPMPPPEPKLPKNSTTAMSRRLDDAGRMFTAVLVSGSWHNHYPGDPRIELDLSRLVSFYDTELVPSLIPSRANKTRFAHRLEDISSDDVTAVMGIIEAVLTNPGTSSGIEWKRLLHIITLRYADRLEIIQHHLNLSEPESAARTPLEIVNLVVQELKMMLTPYILQDTVPPPSKASKSNWAAPVFRYCATTHTDFITSISSLLTPSERLLLRAIRGTNREICRVIVKIWSEAVVEGLDPALRPVESDMNMKIPETGKEEQLNMILGSWRADIKDLMDWLDWSIWIKCKPACTFEEMCYLPTWPFFRRHEDNVLGRSGEQPPSGPIDDDEIFPQPRCVRRVAPYGVE